MRRIPALRRPQIKPSYTGMRINLQHPMNRDLYYWFLFNEGAGVTSWDVCHSMTASYHSGTLGNPRRIGIDFDLCLFCENAAGRTEEYVLIPNTPSVGDFTFVWDGYKIGLGTNYQCAFGYDNDANNYAVAYSYHASFGGPHFFAKMNGGTGLDQAFTWADSTRNVFAIIRRGSNIEFYKDGVSLMTPAASGGGTVTLSGGALSTQWQGSATNMAEIGTYGLQFYTRALGTDELHAFNDQPYGTVDNPRLIVNPYRSRYGLPPATVAGLLLNPGMYGGMTP